MRTAVKVGLGIAGVALLYLAYRKFSGREISQKGIDFLTQLEGFRQKMYKDSRGLPTIGVGHLITAQEPQLLTAALTTQQIKKLFDKDLDRFEKVVKDSIKVPLKQHEKDALVSLAFNIGEDGFKNSSLVKAINSKAGQAAIVKGFSAWNKPSVLKERRAKEARLFLSGSYSPLITQTDFKKFYV